MWNTIMYVHIAITIMLLRMKHEFIRNNMMIFFSHRYYKKA